MFWAITPESTQALIAPYKKINLFYKNALLTLLKNKFILWKYTIWILTRLTSPTSFNQRNSNLLFLSVIYVNIIPFTACTGAAITISSFQLYRFPKVVSINLLVKCGLYKGPIQSLIKIHQNIKINVPWGLNWCLGQGWADTLSTKWGDPSVSGNSKSATMGDEYA